ncbi:MAG: hypothetical protein AAB511_03905 [Patescibacteria group bacterium]|mgnify:CR=1 FL=1
MLRDIPAIEILGTVFQDFDQGQTVEMLIDDAYQPEGGDHFRWSCAQFIGTAEIVACGDSSNGSVRCWVKKIS